MSDTQGLLGTKFGKPSTVIVQRFPFVIWQKSYTFAAQLIFKQKQGNEQL
jgi:hypothetical protein